MLGKLLKYDLKAHAFIHAAMYIISIALTILSVIFDKLADKYPDNKVFTTVNIMTVIAAIIVMIAIFMVTMVLSIIRYYNNLLKDEGYLMHTLPVKPVTLHFSKMITGLTWYIVDTMVIILNIIIVAGGVDFKAVSSILDVIATEMGLDNKWMFIVCVVLYFVLAIISSLSMFYASMNIGSLSNTSKGVMSVVAYIVLYMINQVITAIILVVYGLMDAAVVVTEVTEVSGVEVVTSSPSNEVVFAVVGISVVLTVVFSIAYNVISLVIMNKKLNLE